MLVVPSGYTVIVKSVLASNLSASTVTVLVQAFPPQGAVTVRLLNQDITTTQINVAWNGWVVLPEGSTLTAFVNVASVDFWVSGTILLGTQPFLPNPPTVGFELSGPETKPAP